MSTALEPQQQAVTDSERDRIDSRIQSYWRSFIPSQVVGCAICVLNCTLIVNAARYAFSHPRSTRSYWLTMGCGILWFFVLGGVIQWLSRPKERKLVEGQTSTPQSGRYTDSEVLAILCDLVSVLPRYLRTARAYVADEKSTMAWTFTHWLWPTLARPGIRLSAGMLHYLSPQELKSVMAHELGHHYWRNKFVPGGWFLTDLAILSAGFLAHAEAGMNLIFTIQLCHGILSRLAWELGADLGRSVEHVCDLLACRHVGVQPMANALLKLGEESELAEAVMVRAAKQLARTCRDCTDELPVAFGKVRPYGQIFHDNLFRHSAEIVKAMKRKAADQKASESGKDQAPDAELLSFVAEHRSSLGPRVRWRRFDVDKSGDLSKEELDQLVAFMKEHPDHALVVAEEERNPTTHPSFRDRLLVIAG